MTLVETLQRLLARHPDIQLAYLFGSTAQGTATYASDLDIAIQTSQPLETPNYIQLVEELAIATGRAVDLIDLSKAGEPLLGEILQKGIRLLGSDAMHAEIIKRHLFDRADFYPYVERMLEERRKLWIKP